MRTCWKVTRKGGWSMADIGKAIRQVRVKNNLSQPQLARIYGCTQPYINRVEHGVTGVSLGVLYRFAEALQTEPWQLLKLACQMNARLSL